MQPRKLVAEALGTALLVLLAVGVATLSFGFKLTGGSTLAGVLTTATAYSASTVGLGTDGWGKASMIGIGVGGAFATWSARRRGRSGDWC